MTELKVEPFDPSTNPAYNPAYVPDNGKEMNTGPPYADPPPAYEQGDISRPQVYVAQPASGATVVVTSGNVIQRQSHIIPQSYLVHNILILLFCCCLFGLIGIIKGSQVNSLYASGNYAAAEEASQAARRWYRWGLGFGSLVFVILMITWIILLT